MREKAEEKERIMKQRKQQEHVVEGKAIKKGITDQICYKPNIFGNRKEGLY